MVEASVLSLKAASHIEHRYTGTYLVWLYMEAGFLKGCGPHLQLCTLLGKDSPCRLWHVARMSIGLCLGMHEWHFLLIVLTPTPVVLPVYLDAMPTATATNSFQICQ